jgi:uncharacterized protein (TIGR03086 family)
MEDVVQQAGLGPEVVSELALALAAVRDLTTRLAPGTWSEPTPCPRWNGRDLVNHLAAVTSKFTRFARGDDGLIRQDQGDLLGRDPALGFATIVDQSSAAWTDNPVALSRVCHLPFGRFDGATVAGINLFDAVVHGWDLATAAGVSWEIGDGAVLLALATCDLLVTPEARATGQFGDPRLDAGSTMQRLLARTGRIDR